MVTEQLMVIPRFRVRLQKLMRVHLVVKFPTFDGISIFITVLTKVRLFPLLPHTIEAHNLSSCPVKIHF